MNESPEHPDWLTTEAFYVQRTNAPSPHYLGGPTQHAGADCPECGREVTLTWDLDLTAAGIPVALRQGYSSLRRLPLYVCSQCNVLSYQVIDDENIACFPHATEMDWCLGDESPHYERRAEIERQPIRLNPMPPEIDALWVRQRYLRHDRSLDDDDLARLQGYFDSLEVHPEDPDYYSQLCGDPYWIQGSGIMDCPNPECNGRQRTALSCEGIAMKRLAHISPPDSPGLGDSIGYFDYQFLACPVCFSISVQYECT